MSNQYFDMSGVRRMFDTDMPLFFACLYPNFEWFEKEFSIAKIIEPQATKVLKNTIFPSSIENTDKFVLTSIGFNGAIRKYDLHVYLDNDEKFTAALFENNRHEIVIVYNSNVTVGSDIDDVREEFYRKIIRVKSDLDLDSDTILIRDENYEIFRGLYLVAAEMYPEEVIKTHDKLQKNV